MIDFSTAARIINENNKFLLTTHVNPDADAIGSEIAFYQLLKQAGKQVFILNHSMTPYNLTFLDTDNKIIKYDNEINDHFFQQADVLIALDFNNPKRIVSMHDSFIKSDKIKLCFDHHQHPAEFADYYFIDTSFAATGHIIYELINSTDLVRLTPEIAVPLYAAIMTDTGSFRFDRTTPEVHRIAAHLLEAGADPTRIYDKIFDQSRYSKIKLLGECLSTIKINRSGEIAYMIITQASMLASGSDEAEVDGFVNYCLSIQGVKIGVLFFELNDGIKISFRSKEKIPVNLLAEEFGGGGHTNASGTRLFNVNLYEYINIVLDAAEKILNMEPV